MNSQRRDQVFSQEQQLIWTMHGRPMQQANLQFGLQLDIVILPDGRHGVALNPQGTQLPQGIEVNLNEETVIHEGRPVWVSDESGVAIDFDGQPYPLFCVSKVMRATYKLTFDFLPEQLGGGQIVHNDDLWIEAA